MHLDFLLFVFSFTSVGLHGFLLIEYKDMQGRCRGKFVAPGKFFPPPYCHNVTNANPNPITLNLTLSLILTLTRILLCVGIIFRCDEFSTTPTYLADALHFVAGLPGWQRLHFLSILSLTRYFTIGDRTFPIAAAKSWNSLPSEVMSPAGLYLASFTQCLRLLLYRPNSNYGVIQIISLTYLLTEFQFKFINSVFPDNAWVRYTKIKLNINWRHICCSPASLA